MQHFLTFVFLLFAQQVFSQSDIIGKVIDAKTNEAIPFANVYFSGTSIGTTTGFDGAFELNNSTGAKSLIISSVGYKTETINLGQTNNKQNIVVKLKSEDVKLTEVEIKGKRKLHRDTSALKVYAHVVKYKNINRMENIDFFQYNAYTKTQFDLFNVDPAKLDENRWLKGMDVTMDYLDTTEFGQAYLPMLLKESASKFYFRKYPSTTKEIVLAQKFSGVTNQSIVQLIDDNFQTVDVYDNLIPVSGKGFMGPFSPSGRLTYHYTLADTSDREGHTCYQLYFVGKSLDDLAFKGFAWIDTATWAIKEIELNIGSKVNINFVKDFYVYQKFNRIGKDSIWFVDEETSRNAVAISKKEGSTSFRITRNVSRKDIILNQGKDSKFYLGDEVEYRMINTEHNSEIWDSLRHDTLSMEEKGIYIMVDSVQNTKKYKRLAWLGSFASSAFLRAGPVEFGRFYKFVSWNDIEGVRLRLGARTTYKMSKKLQLTGHVAYGIKDEEFKGGAKAFLHLKRVNNKWHSIEAAYLNDYSRMGVPNPLLTYDNILNSLLRSGPSDDLLKLNSYNALYKKEWVQGIRTDIGYNHITFSSVPGRFGFKETASDGTVTVPEDFTTSEFTLGLRIAKKEQYLDTDYFRFEMNSRNPIITFNYAIGIKDFLGGDFTYHKFDFWYKHKWINAAGYTKYQLGAGTTLNKAPWMLLELHSGNQSFLYNKLRYNLMNEFEYVSDLYGAFWLDHHFDGFIMNKIPGINKLQLRLLVTSKILVGRLRDENGQNNDFLDFPVNEDGNTVLNSPNSPFYAEVGFGVENILKVGRIDFLWRLTDRDKANVKNWGIRIAFQPKF